MPEFAVNLARFNLKVADRGFQARVPIDQPFVAVEQALIIQVNEHLNDGFFKRWVHRELFAAPIHRTAQTAQLASNLAT